MRLRHLTSYLALMTSLAVVLPPVADAAPPLRTVYSGRATDLNRNPLNGTFAVTIAVWTAPTGGALIYQETQPSVVFTDGVFEFLIGLSPSVGTWGQSFQQPNRWLELWIPAAVMSPRQPLTSLAFALTTQETGMLGGSTLSQLTGFGDPGPQCAAGSPGPTRPIASVY